MQRWDLLLVALLVSPVVSGFLFLNTINTVLTVEIVPADQVTMSIPSIGDVIEVYGTWVTDHHILGLIVWNEIHPAVFIRNNTTGLESGSATCKMLQNVHDPERLSIVDPSQPCRWARGRVDYKFQWTDGDWHLDLVLDPQDLYLVKGGLPLVHVYIAALEVLVLSSTVGLGIPYLVAVIRRPEETLIGRLAKRIL